eukprot:g9004.t1
MQVAQQKQEAAWREATCERAVGCLSPDTALRYRCWRISINPHFERLVLGLIFLNALFMALLDYRNPKSDRTVFIENLEPVVFLFAFMVEMFIKMIAFGLITGRTAYLRDPWCILDFVVVVSGFISFVSAVSASDGEDGESSGVSVLRVLRVLRPLRSVARLPGLRKIIRTFFLSVSRLVNVAAMFLFLIVVFGILGINFMGGTLHRFCRFTPEPLVFYNSTQFAFGGGRGTTSAAGGGAATSATMASVLAFLVNEPHALDIATQGNASAVELMNANQTALTTEGKNLNLIARLCGVGTVCRTRLAETAKVAEGVAAGDNDLPVEVPRFFLVWPIDDSSRSESVLNGLQDFGYQSEPPPYDAALLLETARGCGGRSCPLISEKQAAFGVPKRRPRVSSGDTTTASGGSSGSSAGAVVVSTLPEIAPDATRIAEILQDLYSLQNPSGGTYCGSMLYEDAASGFLTGPRMRQFRDLLAKDAIFEKSIPSEVAAEEDGSSFFGSGSSGNLGAKFPTAAVVRHEMIALDKVEDFNWALTGFDNFPVAALTLFQTVTLSGWVDLMYLYEDSFDVTFARFFFTVVIMLGTFFVLNVTLAVVCDAFNDPTQTTTAKKKAAKILKRQHSKENHQDGLGPAAQDEPGGAAAGAGETTSTAAEAPTSKAGARSRSKESSSSSSSSSSSKASSDNSDVLQIDTHTKDIVIDQSGHQQDHHDQTEVDMRRRTFVLSAFSKAASSFSSSNLLAGLRANPEVTGEVVGGEGKAGDDVGQEGGRGAGPEGAMSRNRGRGSRPYLEREGSARSWRSSGSRASSTMRRRLDNEPTLEQGADGDGPFSTLLFSTEIPASTLQQAEFLGISDSEIHHRRVSAHTEFRRFSKRRDAGGGFASRANMCRRPASTPLSAITENGDELTIASPGKLLRAARGRSASSPRSPFVDDDLDALMRQVGDSTPGAKIEVRRSTRKSRRSRSTSTALMREEGEGVEEVISCGEELASSSSSAEEAEQGRDQSEKKKAVEDHPVVPAIGDGAAVPPAPLLSDASTSDTEGRRRAARERGYLLPGDINFHGRVVDDPHVRDPTSIFFGMDLRQIQYNAFGKPLKVQSDDLQRQHRQRKFSGFGLRKRSGTMLVSSSGMPGSRHFRSKSADVAMSSKSAVDLLKNRSVEAHKHVSKKMKTTKASQQARVRLLLTQHHATAEFKSSADLGATTTAAAGKMLLKKSGTLHQLRRTGSLAAVVGETPQERLMKWRRFRARTFTLVEGETFQLTVMLVIAVNAFILSLDKFPPHPKPVRDAVFVLNLVCYAVFVLELVTLHIAHGFQMYWLKLGTCFDGSIVVLSTLELFFREDGSTGSSFTAFRALRVLKLARSWRSFRLLLKSILGTMTQIGNFVLLLVVMIYIFSLLGQAFFATYLMFEPMYGTFLSKCAPVTQLLQNEQWCYQNCHMHDPLQWLPLPVPAGGGAGSLLSTYEVQVSAQYQAGDSSGTIKRNLNKCLPRWHFDDFLWSCLTVFQLISMKEPGGKWGYALYFMGVLTIGVFVVLNVFLAILIGNFGQQQEREQEKRERKLFIQRRSKAVRNLDAFERRFEDREAETTMDRCLRRSRRRCLCRRGDDDESDSDFYDSGSGSDSGGGADKAPGGGPSARHSPALPETAPPRATFTAFTKDGNAADSRHRAPPGSSLNASNIYISGEHDTEPLVFKRLSETSSGGAGGGRQLQEQVRSGNPSLETATGPQQQIDTTERVSNDTSSFLDGKERISTAGQPTTASATPMLPSLAPSLNGNSVGVGGAAPFSFYIKDPPAAPAPKSPRTTTDLHSWLKKPTGQTAHGSSSPEGLTPRNSTIGVSPSRSQTQQLLSPDSVSLREFLTLVLLHPFFDRVILVCIVLSALFIAAQNPLEDPTADWYQAMDFCNFVFTIIFTIEIALRIFCLGFCRFPREPNRYLPKQSSTTRSALSRKSSKASSSSGLVMAAGAGANTSAKNNANHVDQAAPATGPAGVPPAAAPETPRGSSGSARPVEREPLGAMMSDPILTSPPSSPTMPTTDVVIHQTNARSILPAENQRSSGSSITFNGGGNQVKNQQQIINKPELSCFANLVRHMERATRQEAKKLKPGQRSKADQRVPFFRNAWNYLDLIVVIVSWTDEILTRMMDVQDGGLSGLRGLRVFRALRPLRLVQRNESLRLVVDTIFRVLPQLGNIALVAAVVFMVFGLVGISSFKGAFYSCQTSEFLPFPYTVVDPAKSVELLYLDAGNYFHRNDYAPSSMIGAAAVAAGTTLVPYRRESADTPICVLHCENSKDSAFCQQNAVWGYQVLQCSHCARQHCPWRKAYFAHDGFDAGVAAAASLTSAQVLPASSTTGPGIADYASLQRYYQDGKDADFETCYDACQSDLYFCRDSRSSFHCLSQCISQCLCPEACEPLVDDAASCVEQGGKWLNFYDMEGPAGKWPTAGLTIYEHFDNFIAAMITLMELATLQSYADALYRGVDARGPYLEPRRDETKTASLYFVLFLFLGSFFILNLCIGMIVDAFNRVKKESGGKSLFLTDSQKTWMRCQDMLTSHPQFFLLTNLQQSYSHWTRRRIFVLVSQDRFEQGIIACIVLNTLLLCVRMIPEPLPNYNFALECGNLFFLLVFNVEFCLKLYAMRTAYFHLGWNRFDFVCVVASDVGLILSLAMFFAASNTGTAAAAASLVVLRVFRVARLFRLARFLKGLSKVFNAFLLSLPKLLNVGGLVTLLLFFYTIIGMHLFAKTQQFGNNVTVSAHNEYANFRSFWKAFSTLFRCVTGEGWNTLMHNFAADEFFYKSVLERDCAAFMDVAGNYEFYKNEKLLERPIECGTSLSYFFYLSFVFVVLMLALNLFIAVIFEAFDESANAANDEFVDVSEHCLCTWQRYDADYSCYLSLEDAQKYIDENVQLLASVSAEFRRKASEQLEQDPSLWTLSFAKSLYLRINPERKVPVLACILSILRFLIIHGGANGGAGTSGGAVESGGVLNESDHMEILKELEAMNEEYYQAHAAAARPENRMTSSVKKILQRSPSKLIVRKGPAQDLLPLEYHVAAAKIQRIYLELRKAREMAQNSRPRVFRR